MRLERVKIENYRAVRRLTVGLGPVTTVIGEHDCGKSSLIRAIAVVLDPAAGGTLPVFEKADFHLAPGSPAGRATSLAISITFRRRRPGERSRTDAPDEAEIPGAELDFAEIPDRFVLRVEARRNRDRAPETRLLILDGHGRAIEMDDPAALLRVARARTPALVIRRLPPSGKIPPTPRTTGLLQGADGRITEVFRRLSEPGAVLTREIESVMGDVRRIAGTLADRLVPTPERPRSIDDLADTPQPLITDIRAAMRPDAGRHRQVALLLMVGALLEAIPPDGLAPQAEPLLLLDDIETGLHPTWLAAVSSLATSLPLQQVLTTHSSDVLNWMPLRSLRRLVRTTRGAQARFVKPRALSRTEMRRVTYHLRLNYGGALFARCWVLVEGETESWLVPEFARLCDVEFAGEGIRCIAFAQCGVKPLLKLADAMRIGWVLLADGDRAGRSYSKSARAHPSAADVRTHVFGLDAPDIEHYLFRHGFADVIGRAAGRRAPRSDSVDTRRIGRVVREAGRRATKPGLALAILEAANDRGDAGVPPAMRRLAETARDIARLTAQGGSAGARGRRRSRRR